MGNLPILFLVAGGLAAVLANIAIWTPRRLRVRLAALAVTALFLPAGYLSLADLLGRPKPIGIEWAQLNLPEATVLGAELREGEAIYLWLAIAGLDAPRAYVLPWDQNAAKQLHEARRQAEAEGNGVRMRRPFQKAEADNAEPLFYPAPQPTPPAKEEAGEAPLIFQSEALAQD